MQNNNDDVAKREITEVKMTDQQIAAGMFSKLPYNVDQQFNLHQINAFTATVQRNERGKGIHSAFVLRNTTSENKNEFPKGQVSRISVKQKKLLQLTVLFQRSSTSCPRHPWTR